MSALRQALLAELCPPFLAGLRRADVETIVAAARVRRYWPGQFLAHADDAADHLYLLTSGRARSYVTTDDGKRLRVRCHTPGDVVGLRALLDHCTAYMFTTEVGKPLETLVWDRTTLRRLAQRFPQLLVNALGVLSEYVANYLKTHIALTSHTAERRIAQALLDLGRSIGQAAPRGIEFEITNEALADIANTTLFTASRLLSRWQRNGLVEKSRGKVLLRSQELLPLTE